jgi:TM2 domain-containing membrane protein YozV
MLPQTTCKHGTREKAEGMKRPETAFILSFLLPGAGLWYLGKWGAGFLNLGIVLLLGFVLLVALPDEVF